MFLTVKDLKKSYGSTSNKVEVLKGINFEVEKGEICVLLGPSGSGKSTLLNIIGGIDDADLGYVSIDSEKTKDMKEKELTRYRRKHLGYVFQMYNLIPCLLYTSGQTVKVAKLNGEGPVKRRIMDMGITKGVEVYVRKVAPLGDPIEVTVRGYELSLRKADAAMIEVN